MVNRGKDFEEVVKKCFENVPDTTVIRLPDPTNGYLGVRNICDFLVYQYPHIMFIECKSVHGNTMPFSNITDNQWNGMLKQAETKGTICGVICWWVDKDVTKFLPITELAYIRDNFNQKSVRYDGIEGFEIEGTKKRIFFDYNMEAFIDDLFGR